MDAVELRITDPLEALFVEQALAMARELKRVCDAAPDGQVLAQAEQVAVHRGRELTRRGLEAVLNQQAEAVEKRGRAAAPAPVAEHAGIEAATGDRFSRPVAG